MVTKRNFRFKRKKNSIKKKKSYPSKRIVGGGFFDFFRKKQTVTPSTPVTPSMPVTPSPSIRSLGEQANIVKSDYYDTTLGKTLTTANKVDNVLQKPIDVINTLGENVDKIDYTKQISSALYDTLSPLGTITKTVTEIIKIHPIGVILVGTLLFVKKLYDLYKSHQKIQQFLAEVEIIIESSYRLNELIDKINEMMVIYIFNNEGYRLNYDELFNLEKQMLNHKDDSALPILVDKEKALFNGLIKNANIKKTNFRSNAKSIDLSSLDKFIEPNKLIKQQLTIKIAEINKYILGISTNDMLETLRNDPAITKSGVIQLVNDEIQSRKTRFKLFKLYKDKKRDWDRANSVGSIMRKLQDDLIMLNSLFILIKFQLDFTIDFYKDQNIPSAEWNKLWVLITATREYTSYMIPNEVYININTLVESEPEIREGMMALGDLVNVINKEELADDMLMDLSPETLSTESIPLTTMGISRTETMTMPINETKLGGKKRTQKIKNKK